jgi:hypothetical protein
MSPGTARKSSAVAEKDVRFAIEAAIWAPSIHNTQPWWFGTRDLPTSPTISLHADVERRLNVADPDGREMLISCGAALFTLRLAIQHLGYEPVVRLLPDPDRSSLLADIHFGPPTSVTAEIRQLYGQVRRRRSHRGAFLATPIGAHVQSALSNQAQSEHARLEIALTRERVALGALTEAAEQTQWLDPAHVSEAARWAPAPGSLRRDGVHQRAYPTAPERTHPHFPMRDFARGHDWGTEVADSGTGEPGVTGLVALLTTPGDTRTDWLAAGQALQRVLLRASAADLSAAFHTQALEVPELREFIRTRFCGGAHPQVLLRLGVASGALETVRRSADHLTSEEYS